MNMSCNAVKLATLDVSTLKSLVLQQPDEEWVADSYRQNQFEAHKDTETIYLIFDRDFRHSNGTRREKYPVFAPHVEPIFAMLSHVLKSRGAVIRCILTRLRPGGAISPHKDGGFSLVRSHRLHLAVVTSDQVTFVIGGEEIKMREGELWEIDNTRWHSVRNDGQDPRVHLIVDWAPIETEDHAVSGAPVSG